MRWTLGKPAGGKSDGKLLGRLIVQARISRERSERKRDVEGRRVIANVCFKIDRALRTAWRGKLIPRRRCVDQPNVRLLRELPRERQPRSNGCASFQSKCAGSDRDRVLNLMIHRYK